MATKIKKSAMTDNYDIVWSENDPAYNYNIMSYIYDSAGTITTKAPEYPNLFVTCGEKVFISGYWNATAATNNSLSWLELNKYNGLTILSNAFEPPIQCTYRFTFNGFISNSDSSVYAPHTCLWQASIKYGNEEISSITPQQINGSFSHSFTGYTSRKPDSVTFTDTSGYYRSFTIDLISNDFTENDSYMDYTKNVRNELVLKDNDQQFIISLKDSSGAPTTGSVYIINSSGGTLASSTSNLPNHTITVNNITVNKSRHPARAKVIWSDNNSEEVFDLNITTRNDMSLTFQQSEEYDYFSFNGSITFEGNSINDTNHLSITPVIMFRTGTQDTSVSDYMIEINLPEFNLSGIDYDPDWDLDSSYLEIGLEYNGNNYQKTVYFGEATDESSGKDAIYNFGEIDFNSDDWV